jgi:hypothetical protein
MPTPLVPVALAGLTSSESNEKHFNTADFGDALRALKKEHSSGGA